jgi:predicted dehydrogenase
VVQAVRADVDDTYFATVACAGGGVGQLVWSWAGHGPALALPTPVYHGSRGCIQGGQLILDDGQRGPLLERFERELSAADRERFFPLGLREPYAILQLAWLRAIDSGVDPETSGADGLRDLAAAYAMLESSTAGRAVTMDEVLSGAADAYQRPIDEHYRLI